MDVFKPNDVKTEESKNPLFTGKVEQKFWVTEKNAKELKVNLVSFSPGARTKMHSHTGEQVLYITEGKGTVATDKKEHVVTPGTVVFIPVGEKHWHGASQGVKFSHLSIQSRGQTNF